MYSVLPSNIGISRRDNGVALDSTVTTIGIGAASYYKVKLIGTIMQLWAISRRDDGVALDSTATTIGISAASNC